MRVRAVSSAVIVALVMGISGASFAQGGDANEEVKKAVERAVGSSISSSVAESLSRSIVSEGLRIVPRTTVFGSPFYNRTEGDFAGASFNADTGGGVVGGLHKLHDVVLIHGAFAGSRTGTEVSANGADTDGTATFFEMRLGTELVYLNTEPVKAWLTAEGSFFNFDTDLTNHIWAWRAGPSTTFSIRGGPVLFEPILGFAFSDTFEDDDADTLATMLAGTSLKYRGETWRPQLNFAYQKVIHSNIDDDGFISVGPELLYAVTPAILVGGAYSYGTTLEEGIDVDSHTATLELRWTF